MEKEKYLQLMCLSSTKFRRYTGVTLLMFELMVVIVKEYEQQTKSTKGRRNNLSVENQVLMMLEYYREGRTFFHLGGSYGLAESNAQRNIIKVEDILIGSGYFRLQGKKALLSNKSIRVILVDVTETFAQRPKKSQK